MEKIIDVAKKSGAKVMKNLIIIFDSLRVIIYHIMT